MNELALQKEAHEIMTSDIISDETKLSYLFKKSKNFADSLWNMGDEYLKKDTLEEMIFLSETINELYCEGNSDVDRTVRKADRYLYEKTIGLSWQRYRLGKVAYTLIATWAGISSVTNSAAVAGVSGALFFGFVKYSDYKLSKQMDAYDDKIRSILKSKDKKITARNILLEEYFELSQSFSEQIKDAPSLLRWYHDGPKHWGYIFFQEEILGPIKSILQSKKNDPIYSIDAVEAKELTSSYSCFCGSKHTNDLAYCKRCETPYHQECIDYNKGCARYACGGKEFGVKNE